MHCFASVDNTFSMDDVLARHLLMNTGVLKSDLLNLFSCLTPNEFFMC